YAFRADGLVPLFLYSYVKSCHVIRGKNFLNYYKQFCCLPCDLGHRGAAASYWRWLLAQINTKTLTHEGQQAEPYCCLSLMNDDSAAISSVPRFPFAGYFCTPEARISEFRTKCELCCKGGPRWYF